MIYQKVYSTENFYIPPKFYILFFRKCFLLQFRIHLKSGFDALCAFDLNFLLSVEEYHSYNFYQIGCHARLAIMQISLSKLFGYLLFAGNFIGHLTSKLRLIVLTCLHFKLFPRHTCLNALSDFSSCVDAHHPNCGWNTKSGKCVSIRNM